MSALDLDALERRARKGLVLSPDETLALITRLRATEARTAWTDSLALQAHSMATAIEQGDEDGELDALGPVTAAIIRSDVARMLEIVAERPAPLAARTAWQPIETAPRDGTAVLVWWLLSTSDAGGIACFNGERWTQRDGLPYTWAPTHWQPLPAAPEAP